MTDPETERVDALARATEGVERERVRLVQADPEGYQPFSHRQYAAAILAALSADGWRVEREPTNAPHPDAPHEVRNVCQRCGENGYLNVAIITDLEVVRIEPRGHAVGCSSRFASDGVTGEAICDCGYAALRGGPDATD